MKNQYIGGKMSKKGGLAGAKLGGQVGRPPMHFFENKKKYPDFGKNALIVSIFVNLQFKMQF